MNDATDYTLYKTIEQIQIFSLAKILVDFLRIHLFTLFIPIFNLIMSQVLDRSCFLCEFSVFIPLKSSIEDGKDLLLE